MTIGEKPRAFLGRAALLGGSDEINRVFNAIAVYVNANDVAVQHFAERSARQRFRANVADAGSGRETRKARIGQQRNMLAEGQLLERARDLIGFLHPCAHWPNTGQDHNVAGLDAALFQSSHRVLFSDEHARGPFFAIAAVGVHDGGIDGGAFDDGAFGR